ncbi:hypothetical protein [Cognaticolwellia mytili]|uniref:hypothetical protein n=1 Tax=Cognaticolwellia mytili TaxID=1888913 RepID=UPI000A177991|nr:hypothetical protein [Cognaticolwellia mytili]
MSIEQTLNRFSKIAVILWLVAAVQSLLAVFGIFGVMQTNQERIIFGIVELMTMLLVIINAIAIMRYVAQQQSSLAFLLSRLCLYSLILCFFGDIVNRNFIQQFYEYDDVIKHSYLAASVIFFFPGYLIIAAAISYLATLKGLSKGFMITSALITTTIALYTYNDMHITGSSSLLTIITASYSVLVSILAVSAIWLLKALSWRQVPIRIWLAALGLILAMVADAIIGQFWIFGNHGQGYFPIVSHINWIIYLGSQVLIQQLPLGILQLKIAQQPVEAT